MQGLGFLHFRATFQKLVRQHIKWKTLLTEEIRKAEKSMDKEILKQNRRDNRRDIGRKKEIFKNGIKGIKTITGKYNTSKPLTEVKIRCPCGLKWTWKEEVSSSIAQQERELRTTLEFSSTFFNPYCCPYLPLLLCYRRGYFLFPSPLESTWATDFNFCQWFASVIFPSGLSNCFYSILEDLILSSDVPLVISSILPQILLVH